MIVGLQTFDSAGGPQHVAVRLAAFRAALEQHGLHGFVVPHGDEWGNEYLPAANARLLWLTGFAGSAGTAVVLRDRAVLLVDGRYTLVAPAETDIALFEVVQTPPGSLAEWLKAALQAGDRIGYDPALSTIAGARALGTAVAAAGAELVALPTPIDALWQDRPPLPAGPAYAHPPELSGRSAQEKLDLIRGALGAVAGTVLTDPASVAWAFNIRGSDTPHTPLLLARAIVAAQGEATLFVAAAQCAAPLEPGYRLAEPVHFPAALTALAAQGAVALDPAAPDAFNRAVQAAGGQLIEQPDPSLLLRACKTEAEIAGARAAHRRDAVAVVRCLAWLARQEPATLDEIAVCRALEAFRVETGALVDLSFDTIAGFGPNGAIVHYRPSHATTLRLAPGGLLLLDSGAQYRDGTTDITRTVAIGAPSVEMRAHATRVLRGHIAIAAARFPPGTRGVDLDALARLPLWAAGLDYDHGTGHGVGSFASVHEGPQGLSRRAMVALQAGMMLSNEPGYYRAGAYGIRLENLLLVLPAEAIAGGDRAMHGFETLTLVPFDRALIEPAMLSPAELGWLDAYHARVAEEIMPLLSDDAEQQWLAGATAPLVSRA